MNTEKSSLENEKQPSWLGAVSHSASLVLNYLKKHNCTIEFYWWCGIQQYKVVVNGERKKYPRINENNWYEIKPHLKKNNGEYQTGETWQLHCG